MNDFYRTQGGRHFIDGTVPRLVEALNRLSGALEAAARKPGSDPRDQAIDTLCAAVEDHLDGGLSGSDLRTITEKIRAELVREPMEEDHVHPVR